MDPEQKSTFLSQAAGSALAKHCAAVNFNVLTRVVNKLKCFVGAYRFRAKSQIETNIYKLGSSFRGETLDLFACQYISILILWLLFSISSDFFRLQFSVRMHIKIFFSLSIAFLVLEGCPTQRIEYANFRWHARQISDRYTYIYA